ncbi:MAG TPA: GAF domain-containing protein [Thermoanaerobaculia bacterium]|nr:GAF domain-containing protein [Thermoanaerobaculia bacterium]
MHHEVGGNPESSAGSSLDDRARLELLVSIGEALASSVAIAPTLQAVTEACVPRLGDVCFVDLLEDDGRVLQAGVAANGGRLLALAQELRQHYPPSLGSPQPTGRALATREAALFPDLDPQLIASLTLDRRHCELIQTMGLRSAVAVPILYGDRLLGALVLASATSGRRYGEPDVVLLQDVARRVAAALESARLTAEASAQSERLAADGRIHAVLYRLGLAFATERDQHRLLQKITDEATTLVEAEFGSFFFNAVDEQGGKYLLYTLSGAPREAFEGFPAPRATPLFGHTFRGEGVVRCADVRQDPRYGAWGPQPHGHLPVVSYLAVPVVAPGGEVLGGLFFGHHAVGRFTEEHERLIVGMAAQAAIALENTRLYRELQYSEERARLADRRKDEFLAMLGHELRNPLAPILTALELMRLREKQGGGFARERATIERQVSHLTRLVDDLLDLSRIVSGRLQLHMERLDLAAVIEHAVEMASPLLEQRAHKLILDLPAAAIEVDGDGARLAQVVANLLTNAARYTPPEGEIRVRLISQRARAEIQVVDTGEGIADDVLPRLFEPFTKSANRLDGAGGSLGIGLTIVKSLVELHQGAVTASSAGPGRGATFTVTLPIATAVDETQPRPGAGETRVAQGPDRVLVVDDNVDAADGLAELLRTVGFEVRVAYDGPRALAVSQEFRPDVALLDIGLPLMDGYELARELREQAAGRPLRLIAVTGYGQESDRARSRAAGFDSHQVKPIGMETLIDAMRDSETQLDQRPVRDRPAKLVDADTTLGSEGSGSGRIGRGQQSGAG